MLNGSWCSSHSFPVCNGHKLIDKRKQSVLTPIPYNRMMTKEMRNNLVHRAATTKWQTKPVMLQVSPVRANETIKKKPKQARCFWIDSFPKMVRKAFDVTVTKLKQFYMNLVPFGFQNSSSQNQNYHLWVIVKSIKFKVETDSLQPGTFLLPCSIFYDYGI